VPCEAGHLEVSVSWISSVEPEQASGPLQGLYQRLVARGLHGKPRNAWLAQGLDPAALEATIALEEALTRDPAPLSAAQVELIAVVVAATNGCAYCVAHHGPALARALGDETLARAVARDYREANLTARDRVLLDYAVALTCEPSERTAEDVARVREYGLDDAAILKATEIAAYHNLANRLVCALGVELEPGVTAWEFGGQR
jgi:uncharacterized peroxidase-related enzyme